MNDEQELLHLLALQRATLRNPTAQALVMNAFGSATEVFSNRKALREACPTLHARTAEALAHMDEHLARAHEELDFIQRHNIRAITCRSTDYPARLHDLSDAPLLLFAMGNANISAPRILSIVGSRNCTELGKLFCQRFLNELHELCPDVLIVSGLAYGIDINAHRAALSCGLPTLGVLAHGLDQIYPRMHTQTAKQMLLQGGLLTEYQSGANPDKPNFVARNRIVAAMADATLVVESKEKGGSLITTRIAYEHGRPVFAVPGRIGDELSTGCNRLIAEGKASLILSAQDFIKKMGWQRAAQAAKPIQQQLFPNLTAEQTHVLEAVRTFNEPVSANELMAVVQLPFARLSPILFELEMAGLLLLVGGNRYCAR